jgi:hypothetical protein
VAAAPAVAGTARTATAVAAAVSEINLTPKRAMRPMII